MTTDDDWDRSPDAATWHADGSHQLRELRSRLRICRHEVRWQGQDVQWVISPRQVALWTDFRNRHPERNGAWPYNWRFNWNPGSVPCRPSRRSRKRGLAQAA